jgi:GTP-binding protein
MPNDYIITLADVAQIPALFKAGFLQGYGQNRIAFVGRSNVGKSSLINALLQEKVARVSATPGKTKAIHFFIWQKINKIVADLPGYGFAKVSKNEQEAWSQLMTQYFKYDERLEVVVILFDSRHGPTAADLESLEFFSRKRIPLQIVMTKFDQLKTQSDRHHRTKEVKAALAPYGVTEEQILWVSVKDERSLRKLRETFK